MTITYSMLLATTVAANLAAENATTSVATHAVHLTCDTPGSGKHTSEAFGAAGRRSHQQSAPVAEPGSSTELPVNVPPQRAGMLFILVSGPGGAATRKVALLR